MTEINPLEPEQWNVGAIRNSSGHLSPVNLLSVLYRGLSALDGRLFRKLDKSELLVDPERLELLGALVETINSWQLSPISTGLYGSALKRFVRWADAGDIALSRSTIVPLLASYRGDHRSRVASIRRAAAEGLDLTEDERNRLVPAAVQLESWDDDWAITFDLDSGTRTADFLRLVNPGSAALPIAAFARKREALLIDAEDDHSDRAELIRAMRQEYKAMVTAKAQAPTSLVASFASLRKFVRWADEKEFDLTKGSAIEALVSYAQHLRLRSRAGSLDATSVHVMLDAPTRFVSDVTGRQAFEIRPRLRLPPLKNWGRRSRRPEPAQLQEFCANLHAIVRAIPSELLCAPINSPIQVELWGSGEAVFHELPEPLGRYGDQGYDPRLANIRLLRLRIWAEFHRFIAFTGCNFSVAKALTIGDWTADGQRIEVLKPRANKFISVRVGQGYTRHIDAYVEFLGKAFPARIKDDTPLFPEICPPRELRGLRALVAALRTGAVQMEAKILTPNQTDGVGKWAKDKGLNLTARQLRQAKATWVLRRYSGDSFRLAQSLGNKPEAAYNHYGGKGNLEQAIADWAIFWDSAQSQSALAPGKCRAPGRYEPVSAQGQPLGSCSEGACLGCRHYRGEASLDYVHSMLTYRQCLSHRAGCNSEIARLIDIIDRIVDAYLERSPDHHAEVHQLRANVRQQPHPRFAALIQLLEVMNVA